MYDFGLPNIFKHMQAPIVIIMSQKKCYNYILKSFSFI